MQRREITCRRCSQLNVRYSGALGWLRNPKWPAYCTVCHAHLESGERDAFGRVVAVLTWAAIYVVHAFVGAGGAMLVMAPLVIVWPAMLLQPPVVRLAPALAGAILGLVAAEWSRRRGTLLANPKGARRQAKRK